jgi:hypothetical protein
MNITEIERYIEKYLYKIKNLKLETNNSNNNIIKNNQSKSQIAKEDDLDSKKVSFKRNDSLIIKVSPQHQQSQSSRTSLTKSNHKSTYLNFFFKINFFRIIIFCKY